MTLESMFSVSWQMQRCWKRDMFHETVQSFKLVEKIQFPTCNVYGYISNLIPLTTLYH